MERGTVAELRYPRRFSLNPRQWGRLATLRVHGFTGCATPLAGGESGGDVAKLRTAVATSAGGVVYRRRNGSFEIALVGRSRAGIWGLPKGTPQPGETREETALREVREETGLEVRLIEPLGSIDYWFIAEGTRFHKTVHYYLMEAIGGDISRHDLEYDLVAWFPIDKAVHRMTYPNERGMVALAAERLAPSQGTIRHGSRRRRRAVGE